MSNSRARRTLGTWFADLTAPAVGISIRLLIALYGGGTLLAVLGVLGFLAIDFVDPVMADILLENVLYLAQTEPYIYVLATMFYVSLLALLLLFALSVVVYSLDKIDAAYRRVRAL